MSTEPFRRKPELRRGRSARAAGTLLLAVLAACGGDGGGEPPPAAFDEPEYQGLSREEIELQAESMTPAEAERLGIVDTTIRMEAPIHPDSVIELESIQAMPPPN